MKAPSRSGISIRLYRMGRSPLFAHCYAAGGSNPSQRPKPPQQQQMRRMSRIKQRQLLSKRPPRTPHLSLTGYTSNRFASFFDQESRHPRNGPGPSIKDRSVSVNRLASAHSIGPVILYEGPAVVAVVRCPVVTVDHVGADRRRQRRARNQACPERRRIKTAAAADAGHRSPALRPGEIKSISLAGIKPGPAGPDSAMSPVPASGSGL